MKYFLLVIALAAAVLAALMYVPMENGQPLIQPDSLRQGVSESTGLFSAGQQDELPAMYRWRDSSGNWQFGQVPPPGVVAEPMEQKEIRTLSSEAIRQGTSVDSQ
ncbi:DUF4124 domain-containing protein [Alcanivorax sp. 1008]|uniref:DUF4124 domain-containing protein n=1 Tax=Alcanivorax sp. 1008 TaxID=2816853 RepID=UPI001D3F9FB9|nr:DUF4124 domain-containing protein [Alcanivorax sp. 1008]MCC1495862.1 DUF4124 domain-containing protein [Alcanivorax sp. 1008]